MTQALHMLETSRLQLIPCDLELLDALVADRAGLTALTDWHIPEDFPVFPEGIAWWQSRMRSEPVDPRWAIWIFIRKLDRMVIGDGGFKGPPNAAGEVEIGYALIEQARGQGFGGEAVSALIQHAMSAPGVATVLAETLVNNLASIALLEARDFQQTASYLDPDEGEILQWRLDRAPWVARSG